MSNGLTAEQANAIYDLLVEHAGANPEDREDFVLYQTESFCRKWRIMGNLGFGGKFRRDDARWHVTCHQEGLTADRQQMIDVANAALAGLRASYVAEGEALR